MKTTSSNREKEAQKEIARFPRSGTSAETGRTQTARGQKCCGFTMVRVWSGGIVVRWHGIPCLHTHLHSTGQPGLKDVEGVDGPRNMHRVLQGEYGQHHFALGRLLIRSIRIKALDPVDLIIIQRKSGCRAIVTIRSHLEAQMRGCSRAVFDNAQGEIMRQCQTPRK